jgi:hypothetical protein
VSYTLFLRYRYIRNKVDSIIKLVMLKITFRIALKLISRNTKTRLVASKIQVRGRTLGNILYSILYIVLASLR